MGIPVSLPGVGHIPLAGNHLARVGRLVERRLRLDAKSTLTGGFLRGYRAGLVAC